ncbi:hypothetical protein ACU81Q_06200 [Komagataeibacter melomenusus]
MNVNNEKSIFSNKQKISILFLFSIVVLLRLPQATIHGRFFAEDGTIFFSYAWHASTSHALWRSFAGYLNLGANATGLLAARLVRAGYLSLENAPHFTMGIALLFQVFPAVLLLWGKADWLNSRRAIIASLAIIVFCPLGEEVWLNPMHIQYHLILCCGLILALNSPETVMGWLGEGFILLLAPLCGPGAIVLLPLFVLRTLLDRSVPRLVQTVLLGCSSAVQMLVFFSANPLRGQFHDPATLATIILVRMGVFPFSGSHISNKIGRLAFKFYNAHGVGWWLLSSLAMIYCGWLLLVAWRYRRSSVCWLLLVSLAIATAAFGGGMIVSGAEEWFMVAIGGRYTFVPLSLLGIGLVAMAGRRAAPTTKWAMIFYGLMLFCGLKSYITPISIIRTGPNWKTQVTLWHEDHAYPLEVWPSTWTMDLSDIDRSCPKPSLKTASRADPGYCESSWITRQARFDKIRSSK